MAEEAASLEEGLLRMDRVMEIPQKKLVKK